MFSTLKAPFFNAPLSHVGKNAATLTAVDITCFDDTSVNRSNSKYVLTTVGLSWGKW